MPRLPTLLVLLAAASLSLPADANAQPAPGGPPEAVPAPGDAPAANAGTVRYRAVVDAPAAIRALIEQNANLVRWQGFEDMTEPLLDRLAREAVGVAREAAAVEGFFDAEVSGAVDWRETPALVTLKVVPGAPVKVARADIEVVGAAATTDAGRAAVAKLRDAWLLPPGSLWRQAQWTQAKSDALAPLLAGPWAGARIEASEARVDPATATADLSVTLDSGPAFHYGPLVVRGLSRYPESLVEGFSTLAPGAPYDAAEVTQFVRRLASSGYFSSVQAAIDTDREHADAAQVDVAVIEGSTKRVEGSVGYSTDTRYRSSASYSDMNFADRAVQFYADARIEQLLQSASLRFVMPPSATHWRDTFATGWVRTNIEDLITQTASVTWRRAMVEERDRVSFGVGAFLDEQSPFEAPTIQSHALYADVTRTWRRVDDLLSPTRGTVVDVELGGAPPGVSTRTFGRARVQAGYWYPLPGDNAFFARLSIGAVLAESRDGIPSVFLFRTGGDTTVRGYAFESIGVQEGSATVGGRYEAIGSLEATHWFTPTLGAAAFVDAGNATDTVAGLGSPKVGYGLGLRVRTPIGPFRIDVAYGQQVHDVRLHFSVGISF